jgi:predicted RNA-binding Zn-ribbon protein involved in translation (DUF1610 family)
MPKATCRCGHTLSVPVGGPERIVCPKCSAKIRVRRAGDGYVRFSCPCGQRLKVRAVEGEGLPQAGKCPECGRVVPVPSSSSNPNLPSTHPEARTAELDEADVAMLETWSRGHLSRTAAPSMKAEAGLRVCPRCGRPVHLGATTCRECGTHVPRR